MQDGEQHGKAAILKWKELLESEEVGRTAFAIASGYRSIGNIEKAKYYLNVTQEIYAQTDYKRQHAAIAYEWGCVYLMTHEDTMAEQWLQLALKETNTLPLAGRNPQMIATIHHSLGILYTNFNEQYELAQTHLVKAKQIWDDSQDKLHIAMISGDLAYLAIKQGDDLVARQLIDEALTISKELPDSPRVQMMIRTLTENISKIEVHNDSN